MKIRKRPWPLLIVLVWCLAHFCTEKIPEGPGRIEILNIKLMIKENRFDFAQENNWENRYKIPPRNMTQQQFDELSQWQVPFGIRVHNNFDEAIDGQKWIVIKVNIWSANPVDTWQAQLIYADTLSKRNMTIVPGDSMSFLTGTHLTWQQRGTDGNSIHQTNRYTPIWVEAIEFDSLAPGDKPSEAIPWIRCDTTLLATVDTVVAFLLPKTVLAQAEVQLFKNYHSVKSDTVQFRIHYFFPADAFWDKFICREGRRMVIVPL